MRSTGLKKNLTKSSSAGERKALLERRNKLLSIKRQAALLDIDRTSVYRKPAVAVADEQELAVMNRIDEIHTAEPTWGYRTITSVFHRDGISINHKRIWRLMRLMGIYAIYPKPNLSKRYHAEYVRPYLLRNLEITRADQVWGIVDYELSSTFEKTFVINCLKRALTIAKPEIINSDQGGHFTNPSYINLLTEAGVKISMDGNWQCLANARTERFSEP